MKRALYVALNEVRLYIRDKGDLAFGMLLPIVTFALMYGAFGGHTLFEATAPIVDEDGGPYAARLVAQLEAVPGIDIDRLTAAQADTRLERSDLQLVLYIPAGFSDALAAGEPAQLVFRQRGNGGQEGQILASIIRGVAGDIDREFRVHRQVAAGLAGAAVPADRIAVTVQELLDRERRQPAVAVAEEVVGGSPDFINQFLPGIVVMYVLFSLTLSARVIVEERKRGTLERLLTTRLSVGGLYFGKFMSSVFRGFIQTFILLGLSYIVFRFFTPVSFLAALVVAFVFAAAAAALGMIIASIARSEDGAAWIGVVFTMTMVMLGGTFFQVAEGSVLDTIGKISIITYGREALGTIIAGSGTLGDNVFQLTVLAGVAVVGLVISRLIFRAVPGGK
ncbi:MAG TPA: ABC transporter permease [Dehalococcoidales bacterium]|nr:ABC transporter permease [Dehalococcoidales bacterium]